MITKNYGTNTKIFLNYLCLFFIIGTQAVINAQDYNLPKEIGNDFIFNQTSDNKIHVTENNSDFVFYKGTWKKQTGSVT